MRAVVAVLLLVTAAHAAIWGVLRDQEQAPDFRGILPSASYTAFEPKHTVDVVADTEKVRADMKKLASLTKAVRLYSSTEGAELVPPIAAEFGLKVTLGVWIDKDTDRNKREIASAIKLARDNGNVIGIVVGNETVYRGEQVPLENLADPGIRGSHADPQRGRPAHAGGRSPACGKKGPKRRNGRLRKTTFTG